MYVVSIEGQTIQLPPGVGEKDEDVKRAMTPFFPEVTTALLKRTTKGEGDAATVTIEIVKKAGSKGSAADSLANLAACTGGKNPAVVLYEQISAMGAETDLVRVLEMERFVDEALKVGTKQAEQMHWAQERLVDAQAQPAPFVVLGF